MGTDQLKELTLEQGLTAAMALLETHLHCSRAEVQ
jgi:hypothetical protein